jgi:hypothetical protein
MPGRVGVAAWMQRRLLNFPWSPSRWIDVQMVMRTCNHREGRLAYL